MTSLLSELSLWWKERNVEAYCTKDGIKQGWDFPLKFIWRQNLLPEIGCIFFWNAWTPLSTLGKPSREIPNTYLQKKMFRCFKIRWPFMICWSFYENFCQSKVKSQILVMLVASTTVRSAKCMLKAQHQYISVKAEKDCKKELKIWGSLSMLLPSDINTDCIITGISPTGRKHSVKWSQHRVI